MMRSKAAAATKTLMTLIKIKKLTAMTIGMKLAMTGRQKERKKEMKRRLNGMLKRCK